MEVLQRGAWKKKHDGIISENQDGHSIHFAHNFTFRDNNIAIIIHNQSSTTISISRSLALYPLNKTINNDILIKENRFISKQQKEQQQEEYDIGS